MMGESKKPQQEKLENICDRIKMKREFTSVCCMQLKLLNASKYNVESWMRYENKCTPAQNFVRFEQNLCIS